LIIEASQACHIPPYQWSVRPRTWVRTCWLSVSTGHHL